MQPFWIAELPSEDIAQKVARRSVTLRHITELWVQSNSDDELHRQLRKYSDDVLKHDTTFCSGTFKFNVEVYCNTQNYAEKVSKIEVNL